MAGSAVEEIFEIVKNLAEQEKVSILLADQNTNVALRYAHYGYILENGRGGEGRRSFRDVKHYRRRKRWL